MSVVNDILYFQKLIGAEGRDKLYDKLITSEYKEFIGAEDDLEKIKEAADLIVVALGYIYARGFDANHVLHEVNKNNMSKFDSEDTVGDTVEYYRELGVEVEVNVIDSGVFGVYSTKDQTVNGYHYEKGKLLKPVSYKKLDNGSLVG